MKGRSDRDLGLYDASLHLVTTPKARRRTFAEFGEDPQQAVGAGLTFIAVDRQQGRSAVVIWIDERWHAHHADPAVELRRTATHEAVHAAGMILDRIECPYTGSSEPHAYLVESVASWLWSELGLAP